MTQDLKERFRAALAKVDRPGTYCASGSMPAILPGLVVEGVGTVGLPLTTKQAKDIRSRCEQAPYGKGTETLVDTDVRRVWRLTPEAITLTNPEWPALIDRVLAQVQHELGLEKQKLEAHLYDLLLYEKGSFFLPHRDGEKLDRMVATLVVSLPSKHSGGELVIRHEGTEKVIDFGGSEKSEYEIQYAAFYADCEHEVPPVRSGHRLCLVYNLTLSRSKQPLTAPRDAEHVLRIAALLREWALQSDVAKLAVSLEHQYTEGGVAWDTLKGADASKARVLAEAAHNAGWRAYLGLLELWESGSSEGAYDSYASRRSRRWYRSDHVDRNEKSGAGHYVMDEVYDEHLLMEDLTDRDGNELSVGHLSNDEGDLIDPDALRKVTPEEQYEGYTGNAGMTLDRWYRHAALALWPEAKHFRVLCNQDGTQAIPLLRQMTSQLRRAPKGRQSALKEECLLLAREILGTWPEKVYSLYQSDKRESAMFDSLVALGDPALIGRYLGETMRKDVTAAASKSLATACAKHGWELFLEPLTNLVDGTSSSSMIRNVQVLEQLSSPCRQGQDEQRAVCRTVANRLLSALKKLDADDPTDWRARNLDRKAVLIGIMKSLIRCDANDLLDDLGDFRPVHPEEVSPRDGGHPNSVEFAAAADEGCRTRNRRSLTTSERCTHPA